MTLSGLPTYHACILQARAYRTLRLFMSAELQEYDLTMMEWVLLGLTSSKDSEGHSTTELAEILDVGLPLITNMVDRVEKMGLVARKRDAHDKRSKRIFATSRGRVLADHIELKIREDMKEWLCNVEREDLEGYVKTMSILATKDPVLPTT